MIHPCWCATAAVLGLVFCTISCTPAKDWGRAGIARDDDEWNIVLENDLLLARYTTDRANKLIKDRITEFRLKKDDKIVANKLDGRHADKNQEFFRITKANVEPATPGRKTVKLVLQRRVEYVSILKDLPVLEIRYSSGGHNLDYGIEGWEYVIYGEDAWAEQNHWERKHPELRHEVTESGSYYRSNWSPPGPLSYKGWMILGVIDRRTDYGAGLVLPADKVRWLKLVGSGTSRGFERWMTGAHTAYLYPVSGGADEILSMGKKIVDTFGESSK